MPKSQNAVKIEIAREVFEDNSSLKWVDLHEKIMTTRKMSKNTAERRITLMRELGVIKQGMFGKYQIVT